MSTSFIIKETLRLLEGIEDGNLDTQHQYNIIEKIDPILTYFVIRYLREKYKTATSSSSGVLNRIVELTSNYPKVIQFSRQGETDIMREWFDEGYKMKDYYQNPEEFVELIVDKLES